MYVDAIAINPVNSLTTAKPILSTISAQSSSQITPKSILPPLKQKTGIVKSKVPPPVPPRGSPRDRRPSGDSHKTTISARGASPQSGELNYLNDKYFDCVRPNANNSCKLTPTKLCSDRKHSITPIFGNRRSPTCVSDWLEVNDFSASNYDLHIIDAHFLQKPKSPDRLMPIALNKRTIQIKTSILQRENSFRSSGSSVQMMVKNYCKQINQKRSIRDFNSINGLDICDNNENLIRSGHVKLMKSNLEIQNLNK